MTTVKLTKKVDLANAQRTPSRDSSLSGESSLSVAWCMGNTVQFEGGGSYPFKAKTIPGEAESVSLTQPDQLNG